MKTYGRRSRKKNALNVAPVNHLHRKNKFVEDLPDHGEEDSQAVEPWDERETPYDDSQPHSDLNDSQIQGESSDHEANDPDGVENLDPESDHESEAETQPADDHFLFNTRMPPSTQPRNWTRKRAAMESPLQDRGKKARLVGNLGAPAAPTAPSKTVRFEGPMSSSPLVLSSELSRPSPSQAPITPITPADVAHPPSTPDKYIVGVVPSTTPNYSPLTMKFDDSVDGGVARRLFETESGNKDKERGVFDDNMGLQYHEKEVTKDAQETHTTRGLNDEPENGSQHSNNTGQIVADSQWQDEVLCSDEEEESEDVQVVPSSSQDQEILGGPLFSITSPSSGIAFSSMPAPSSASSLHHSLDPEETVDETPSGFRDVSFAKSTQEESQYVPGETQYGPGESLYEPEGDSDDFSETQRAGYTQTKDDSCEDDSENEESQKELIPHELSQHGPTSATSTDHIISDSQYCPNDELLEDVDETNEVETNDELHRDGQGYDWCQSQSTTRSQSQRNRPIELSDDEPAASMDIYHDAHESLSDTRDEEDLEAQSISDDDEQHGLANKMPHGTQQPGNRGVQIIPDSDDDESPGYSPFKQPTQPRPQFTLPSASLKRVRLTESQEPQPITESQLLMSGLFMDSAHPHHNDDDEDDVVIPVRRQNDSLDEDDYVSDSQDEGDVFPRPSLKREAFAHLPPLPAKPSITSSDMETQAYIGHSITDTLLEPLSDPDSLTQDE